MKAIHSKLILKKEKFASDFNELKKLWGDILTYDVLSRYVEFKDEENGEGEKDKDGKDKKVKVKEKKEKTKKLTHAELEKKAREAVEKSYVRIFSRINKEKRSEQLDKFFNAVTRVF